MPTLAPPLPDLSDRRALVTGASSGVGREIARALAAAGAAVVLPVRSPERGASSIAAIREPTPEARLELRELDLARLTSVRALAAALSDEGQPVDMLVLNAGIVDLGDRTRHVTEDGFELHLQTNFLGHVALTLGILPLLRAARTRVVVQCSLASALYGVDEDDLQQAHRYSPLRAYGSSKTALGLFGCELARRCPELTVDLCHPGIVPSTAIAPALRARIAPGILAFAVRHLGSSPAEAAAPALTALTADASTPGFFAPSGLLQFSGPARRRRPFRRIADPAAAARIWAVADGLLHRS